MTANCLPVSSETKNSSRNHTTEIIAVKNYSSNHNRLQVTPVAAHQVRKVESPALEPDACMSRGHGPYLERTGRGATRDSGEPLMMDGEGRLRGRSD